MTLSYIRAGICAVTLVMFWPFGMAFAAETPTEPSTWQQQNFRLMLGKGHDKKNKGRIISGEYMYTTGPDQMGNVALTCLGGSFMVVVSTDDISISKNFRDAWMYPNKRKRRPTVMINEEQQDPNHWVYLKKRGIAIPQERKLSLKIYNAAIRQDKILVDFDNKKSFSLNLPKPNTDFAEFGAECGMGRYK